MTVALGLPTCQHFLSGVNILRGAEGFGLISLYIYAAAETKS